MNPRLIVAIGAAHAGLAVSLGAFGAHALKNSLDPYFLGVFEVGVRYQMYHAIALMILGICSHIVEEKFLKVVSVCFGVGIIIFSGSLYCLAVSGQRWLGAITPIGGVLFLLGWLFFVRGLLKRG